MPAVASAVVPDRPNSTRPVGSATAVVGPLSSATAPEDAASRRAAAMRSGPGSAPISRAYSPSWGVRTTTRAGLQGVVAADPAQGEQAVGVHHDRDGRLGHQAPDLGRRPPVPAQAGTDHHRGAA